MRLTISVSNGQLVNVDVSDSLPFADLKAYILAETDVEPSLQKLTVDGKPLTGDSKTLEELGMHNDDLLVLEIDTSSASGSVAESGSGSGSGPVAGAGSGSGSGSVAVAGSGSGSAAGSGLAAGSGTTASQPPRMSAPNIFGQANALAEEAEYTRQLLLENKELVTSLKRFRPNISALLSNSQDFLQYACTDLPQDLQAESKALEMNPEDPENQPRILQLIRQDQIDRNYQLAHDITPEAFVSINMLYVKLKVNGHEIVAFVDTGAQISVIAPKVAEQVGISHLVDTRFKAIAQGVGQLKTEGRIHSVSIGFPNSDVELPTSFTVLDASMDLLLGLDMMKRHKCVVDLNRNVLVMGGTIELPFLSDVEIERLLGNKALELRGGPQNTPAASATANRGSNDAQASNSTNASANRPVQGYPEKDIKTLVDLGFTRAEAIRALNQCQGNVDFAAALLFQ